MRSMNFWVDRGMEHNNFYFAILKNVEIWKVKSRELNYSKTESPRYNVSIHFVNVYIFCVHFMFIRGRENGTSLRKRKREKCIGTCGSTLLTCNITHNVTISFQHGNYSIALKSALKLLWNGTIFERVLGSRGWLQWNCHVNETAFQSGLRFQTGSSSLWVSCKRPLNGILPNSQNSFSKRNSDHQYVNLNYFERLFRYWESRIHIP